MSGSPSVGDAAPAFELPGTGGRSYRLGDFRGQRVVLVFYPGDNSPVCTAQLLSYTDDVSRFDDLGVQVLAISPQDVASHEAFSSSHGGFGFPLLADTDKAVGRAYGILGPLGFYRRSIFVVDPDGRLVYAHRSATGMTYMPTDRIVEELGLA